MSSPTDRDRADDEENDRDAPDEALEPPGPPPARVVGESKAHADRSVRKGGGEHRRVPGDPDGRREPAGDEGGVVLRDVGDEMGDREMPEHEHREHEARDAQEDVVDKA